MDGVGEGPDDIGFDMPMLMNQQTNLYGSVYGQDTSPTHSAFPGLSFQDEPAMGTGEDNNDAKRRRIARVSPLPGLFFRS